MELPGRSGARDAAYRFASLDYPATERRFNGYHAEFLPVAADKQRAHQHAGVEFIYVIQGTLIVHIGSEDHALEAGDAIYFDSTVPHAYRRKGARTCNAVVVTATDCAPLVARAGGPAGVKGRKTPAAPLFAKRQVIDPTTPSTRKPVCSSHTS